MASFTEMATLIVKDESSSQIRKINAELKKLFATAKGLKSQKFDLSANVKGLDKASSAIHKLTADMGKLKAAGAVKLNVATGGLTQAQRQINQLRASAARPIRLGTIAAAVGIHGAAGKVIEAGKAGVRAVDIGETSLALKEFSTEHRNFIEKQIDALGREQAARPGGAMFNRGQISQEVSEMLAVVKVGAATSEADFQQRVEGARYLADQNFELAGTLVKLGMSAEQARESATKFGKAVEQRGTVFDVKGNLDIKAAQQEYDTIRKLIPAIGKEATGENFLSLMKFLRVSKFSLEPEAIASAMAKFEEMGTGAAVGINQMIKNLGVSAKKYAIKEQMRLGLRGPSGEVPESDAELMRKSPQRYINERYVPALKKDLMERQKLTEAQAEVKLNDPAFVSNAVQKAFSHGTAQEMAASMVLLRHENAQFLADFRSRAGTLEKQREATKYSVLGASTAISNQFSGVIGQAVVAAAPVLTGAMNTVSGFLQTAAEDIAGAGKGDMAAATRLADKAVVAATTSGAATIAAKAVASTIAAPLGLAAGITGMTAADPAVRSLSAAGVSLIGAADALKASAAFGMGGWAKMFGLAVNPAALIAMGVGAAYSYGRGQGTGPEGKTSDMADAAIRDQAKAFSQTGPDYAATLKQAAELSDAFGKVSEAAGAAQLAERQLALARRRGNRDEIARLTQESAARKQALDEARRVWALQRDIAVQTRERVQAISEAGGKPIVFKQPLKTFMDAVKAEVDEQMREPSKLYQPKDRRGREAGKPIPLPRADPRKQAGVMADPATSLDVLKQATQNFSTTATTLGTTVDGFKLAITETPRQFATVFDTGAKAVGDAGTVAADALAGRAGGIGSTLGNAAADAIIARVSNMPVNVNVKTTGTDTGSQKVTPGGG